MTMTSFDDFVEQLLYDVTLAGNEGIAAEELEQGVRVFAELQRSSRVQQTPIDGTNLVLSDASASVAHTNDDSLVDAVWNHLESHADFHIRAALDQEESSLTPAGDEISQTGPTESTAMSYPKHPGERVFADRRLVCETIAGHPWNFRLLPNKEFDLLSIIAAHGPDGILQPDLRKLALQDKRSVPKRTDDLAAKGYILKEKVNIKSQPTAILKLMKFSKEGIQRPQHVRAYPESTSKIALPMIYYDSWFDNFLRLLKENGGIITIQDIRVGLSIHESSWGIKALSRCIDRLVEVGLVRKLKVRVEGETSQSSADCWMNCVQQLREPTDGDRATFSGASDSERTRNLKRKFSQTRSKEARMSEDDLDDESDDNVASTEDVEDIQTDGSSTEDERRTSVPRYTVATSNVKDRETTTVDRSGNLVSFRITYNAVPPQEPELEEWGFLKLRSKSVEDTESEERILQWDGGNGGEIRSFNELEHRTVSHRKFALLNWTPNKNTRRNIRDRIPVMEVDGMSTRRTTEAPKRTSDQADLADTGPSSKIPRIGEGRSGTLNNILRSGKILETPRKDKMRSDASIRSISGVYVNPNDAQETRFRWRRRRGPRPKSIVLVFKSDKLKDLTWFAVDRVEQPATTVESPITMPNAAPIQETDDHESNTHSTDERRVTETPVSLPKRRRGRPRKTPIENQRQIQAPLDVEHQLSTPRAVISAPGQESSPYNTAPAFSTRRSQPGHLSAVPSTSAAPLQATETELPGAVATLGTPTGVTPNSPARDPNNASNPYKKRKRGRPSKAEIAARERLMQEEEISGKTLIVRLPIGFSRSPEHVGREKRTETLSGPTKQDSDPTKSMANSRDSASSPGRLVSLPLPSASLLRASNESFPTSATNEPSFVQLSVPLDAAGIRSASNDSCDETRHVDSRSNVVKFSLPALSRTTETKPSNATASDELLLDGDPVPVLQTRPAKPDSEAPGSGPASATSNRPSLPPVEQSVLKPFHGFESSPGSHWSTHEPDLTLIVGSNDMGNQNPRSSRARRDSTGFPAIEGLTVRRTAAGLAVGFAELESDLETKSPVVQHRVPTPRKTGNRQVSRTYKSAKASRGTDATTAHKSLLMIPTQYFHEHSGTIGTTGISGYTISGIEPLQMIWKKNHPVPKDLQNILHDFEELGHRRRKASDSRQGQFNCEVERVRIWEEDLVNDGCFLDADVGKIFINHRLNSASRFPMQYPGGVVDSDFIFEHPGEPKTKARSSSGLGQNPALTSPGDILDAFVAPKGRAVGVQNAPGYAELFPVRQSVGKGLQSHQTQSLRKGSISGLYPGPDLPKEPLLPLSRYWTLPTPNENRSDGLGFSQSQHASNISETDDSSQQRQQARFKPNANGAEDRSTSSWSSRSGDDYARVGKSVENLELEQSIRQIKATTYTRSGRANKNLTLLTSQSDKCGRCSKLNKPCIAGSTTERCGFCKTSHALCSKVDADRAKLEKWGRNSTEAPGSQTELEMPSIFQGEPHLDMPLSKVLERMYAGGSTSTSPEPIQPSKGRQASTDNSAKRRPYVYKSRKPRAPRSGRTVDIPTNSPATDGLDSQTRSRNDTTGSEASRVQTAYSATSARPRPFAHPQRFCIAVLLATHLCSGAEPPSVPNWDVVEHALSFMYDKVALQNEWDQRNPAASGFMKQLEDAFKPTFLTAYANDEIPHINLDQSNEIDRADWPALVQWVENKVLPVVKGCTSEENAANAAEEYGNTLHEDLSTTRRDFNSKYELLDDDSNGVHVAGTDGLRITPDLVLPSNGHHQDFARARSWVRALVMTEDMYYDRDRATRKLQSLGNGLITYAVADLEKEGSIVRKKAGRQIPGRNHRISRFALSNFSRWPGNEDEHKYVRFVATARDKIVKHFEHDNVYNINSGLSEAESLVLDSLADHGRLKRTLDIKSIKVLMSSGGSTDIAVSFTKTAKYTSDHGLKCNIKIPSQPRAPLEAAIPFWVDIHGHFLDHVWDMVLRSMLHVLVYQPGTTVEGIKVAHKGQLFPWEIELVLDWMEKTGLAEKIARNNEQSASSDERWKASQWWYCAFLPEVAKWKQPVSSLRGEE